MNPHQRYLPSQVKIESSDEQKLDFKNKMGKIPEINTPLLKQTRSENIDMQKLFSPTLKKGQSSKNMPSSPSKANNLYKVY